MGPYEDVTYQQQETVEKLEQWLYEQVEKTL